MQDVVLVFVTVSGMKKGSLVQEVFARKIFADRNEKAPLSAIQITTAAGICAAVDLFREGKVRRYWAKQPSSEQRPRLLERLYP